MARQKDATLNKDRECPSCGCSDVKDIGAPGKIFDGISGTEIQVPVGFSRVIECTDCTSVRGR